LIDQNDYLSTFTQKGAYRFKTTETVDILVDNTTKSTGRTLASANLPGATKNEDNCKKMENSQANRKEMSSVFRGKPHISLRTSVPPIKQATKTIVIGSSTLSHLWRAPTFKPLSPVDFECIIGGRVTDVHKMFLATYGDYESPLNVIVCCGVNNIPIDSSEEIIKQFKRLAQAIIEHNENNKIVLSSILFAPKFCERGTSDYLNHIERTRRVNSWIKSFNTKETELILDLSKFGIKGNSSNTNGIQFVYEDWKEDEIHKKLHLSYVVKKKVAVEVTELCNVLQNKKKTKIPDIEVASSFEEHEV
jgi:hypothetical protein